MRLCLALILLAGCSTQRFTEVPPTPQVSSICLVKSPPDAVRRWEREAAKRLHNPVVIIGHGEGSDPWTCYPDIGPDIPVEALARLLHELFPRRDCLLIICNPHNATIDVPNVYYSDRNVWLTPGARWRICEGRWTYDAGQIWDFKTGK